MPNLIDLTGQRFGRLEVISRAPNHGRNVMWHCKCDCGNEKDVAAKLLRNGHTQSCGCLHTEQLIDRTVPNLIGQKFGKLIVLEKTDLRKDSRVVWKCQCDCGNIAYVTTKNLRSGAVKSCGCLMKEQQHIFGQRNSKDITGQRFGKLIAIKKINNPIDSQGSIWECKCDCGNSINVKIHNLTDGSTQSCGCLKSLGETKISSILEKNNIYFERQKTFSDCINPSTNCHLFYDFYLPDYNLLIEYDGAQHFYFTGLSWNTEENFKKTQERDKVKNDWAKNHNIKLIRIPYTQYNNLTLKNILGEME